MREWFSGAFVRSLAGAAVGFVVCWVSLHLWVDHVALHQIFDALTKQAQAAQAAPAPKPAP
jgi:hypothetical protein